MSDVFVFSAAVDTIVAGIYRYDTWMVEAETKEHAEELFEATDPWDDVSTSVEAYMGRADTVAAMDHTIADELKDRYKVSSDAE